MINEDFVSYEIAQALKKAGFDWPTQAYFAVAPDNSPDLWVSGLGAVRSIDLQGRDVLAPTLAQAQKWLRETHQWHIIIIPQMWKGLVFDYSLWHTMRGYENKNRGFNFSSYEAALSAGLTAVLEILINRAKEE